VRSLTFSAVEQWPARRAHNPEVAGSNPARATNFKLNTMTEIKETYLDVRIEQMLIAKIAHYRLNIREGFRERHKGLWPELNYKRIMGDIRDLKVWMHMAKLIEKAYDGYVPAEPYTVYKAKKLSK
tara:strand:+ start:253 stop:630 length:378 start_codon:yes stop_codon:yes gene_type:complete